MSIRCWAPYTLLDLTSTGERERGGGREREGERKRGGRGCDDTCLSVMHAEDVLIACLQ